MHILDEAVGAPDEPGDQLGTLVVHYIVVGCSPRVPQVETGVEEVADGEDRKPLGSEEAFRRNRLPTEAAPSTNTEIPKKP